MLVTLAIAGSAGAVRIYLNPSDQTGNWSPDGTYCEAYAMQDVANRLASKLSGRGFEVQNSNGASMQSACSAANAWPADAFVSLHTNASGSGWNSGHGSMGFYYQSASGWHSDADIDLADRCVHKCVEKFSAWGRGYDRGTFADYPFYGYNLYVLLNTTMTSTLIEGLFHDNYDDVQVLKSDAGKDAYAQAIYEAVCDHYGWSYNNPTYNPTPMASPVSVVSNSDGRLEIFARGNDGACWHNWQTTPNGAWNGWASLGGGITDTPVAARNSDGRLVVFVRGTDGNLYQNYQTSPGGGWSGWYGMGIAMGWLPAAGVNTDGRMEVFVRGNDGAVYRASQTSPSGPWSAWASMGGYITDWPAVSSNADGRMEIFARGGDGKVYTQFQTSPGGGWSGWYSLPDIGMGWTPTVGKNADGRMECFARGNDGAIWHSWQASPNGSFSAWSSLGGSLAGAPQCVVSNADGRLELFAKGNDNAVYGICQTAPNSGWSAWYSLGGAITDWPAAGRNLDGRLELFVRSTDGYIWHKWQSSPGGSWSGYSQL